MSARDEAADEVVTRLEKERNEPSTQAQVDALVAEIRRWAKRIDRASETEFGYAKVPHLMQLLSQTVADLDEALKAGSPKPSEWAGKAGS